MKRILTIGVICALLIGAVGCGQSKQGTGSQSPAENGETPIADATPPSITEVSTSDVTEATAIITWTTDEPATSQVEYGTTSSYGSSSTLDATKVTSHSVTLSSLSASTTYHYRVKSKDSASNEAASGNNTFTTAAPDTTAPVISGIGVSAITTSTATITWTTDEPATSQVEYGETIDYSSTTSLNENLLTNQNVDLSGLIPATTYHFSVISTDLAGNEVISGDYIFTTLGTRVSGIISSDATWTKKDSPYVIADTIQIPSGVMLTIESGVTITKPTSGDMFLLLGTICAHGTSQEPIVIDGGGNSKIIYTQPGYGYGDFQCCTFKNGYALWDRWGHLDLRYSELMNLSTGGTQGGKPYDYIIQLDGPSGESNIEYNKFINTGGIYSYNDKYGTNIRYNLFQGLLSPLAHMGGGTPSNPPMPMIVKYNSFIAPKGLGLALSLASGFIGWSPSIDAAENYWGTQDTNIIDQMIYDRNDYITIQNYIAYLPILAEPHPDTPTAETS